MSIGYYGGKNDAQLIVYNSDVIMNPNKYSVYGVSSAASTHLYTQTLQIHDINEDDNGTYSCKLVFSSNMLPSPLVSGRLIITDFGIPHPTCSNKTGTSYPIGQVMVTLVCSCPSCYSQTILQWFDNEGKGLTNQSLVTNTNTILAATFSKEFYESNQWFKCRATRPGSTEIEECVIGNRNVKSVVTVTDSSITATISPTNGIIPKTMITTGDIKRVTTTTIKRNQSPLSETTYERSTVESKITSNKDISHTPSISKLISGVSHHMQTEASLPPDYTTSANSTKMLSSSSDSSNITIIQIIIVVVSAGILVVVLIIMLITVGKRNNAKTKNEAIDFHQPKHWLENTNSSNDNDIEGETAIDSEMLDSQLIPIQFDGVDHQLEYKNSALETDTDDPDPSYAAVNLTIVDESRHQKISDPLRDYSGVQLTGNTDDPYQAVGPAGNIGQQCPMADYQKNKAPLESASEMSTADMEFKRKPSVPAKKPNKSTKSKVINYPAPNMDMYAQVDKSSKSISNRITTLLRNEEHRREKKKETERNDKLINLTKASLGFMDIDNDDTYSTVSDVIPSKTNEGIKKETEIDENDDGEDDNLSSKSLHSTGSIHYSVDEDTVYTRVLKQQKLTT